MAAEPAATPEGPPKRTMMGISGVDEAELQRAIDAARAAAAGKAPAPDPKRLARRTMLGVVAVQAPAVSPPKSAPAPVDEGWGTGGLGALGGAAKPAADPLDDGWGASELPVPLVAKPQGLAKGTFMLTSMPAPAAAPPPDPSSAKRAPAPEPRTPVAAGGTMALSSLTPPPAAAPPEPVMVMGTMPVAKPSAPEPPGAGRTMVFGAKSPFSATAIDAEPPSRPAPAPPAAEPAAAPRARPITGSGAAPAAVPASRASEARSGAAAIAPTVASEVSAAPIANSSPDPLADTIAPGSLRIEELLAQAPIPPTSMQPQAVLPPTAVTPAVSVSARGASTAVAPALTQFSASLKKATTTTSPPFLASKALQEDMTPTEPGRGWMRALSLGLGVLLLGLWTVPVSFDPVVFAWTAARELSGAARALSFFTPAAALLLVLVGALPLPYRVRAVLVLLLAAFPLFAGVGGLGPLEVEHGWAGGLVAFALLILPGALVFRANYRASALARVWVALGILLVVAWALLPDGSGYLPAVMTGFAAAGGLGIANSAWMVLLLVLCALSLLAFMSSATTGGCGTVGRLLLLWRPGLVVLAGLSAGTAAQPVRLAVQSLSLFAFGALASYGLAQAFSSLSGPGSSRTP